MSSGTGMNSDLLSIARLLGLADAHGAYFVFRDF
jgi:hypothetical protein